MLQGLYSFTGCLVQVDLLFNRGLVSNLVVFSFILNASSPSFDSLKTSLFDQLNYLLLQSLSSINLVNLLRCGCGDAHAYDRVQSILDGHLRQGDSVLPQSGEL